MYDEVMTISSGLLKCRLWILSSSPLSYGCGGWTFGSQEDNTQEKANYWLLHKSRLFQIAEPRSGYGIRRRARSAAGLGVVHIWGDFVLARLACIPGASSHKSGLSSLDKFLQIVERSPS